MRIELLNVGWWWRGKVGVRSWAYNPLSPLRLTVRFGFWSLHVWDYESEAAQVGSLSRS